MSIDICGVHCEESRSVEWSFVSSPACCAVAGLCISFFCRRIITIKSVCANAGSPSLGHGLCHFVWWNTPRSRLSISNPFLEHHVYSKCFAFDY